MAEQRASDADREQAVEHLRRAGGDGRLSVDELDERLGTAYASRTRGELEALLADVGHDRVPAVGASGPSGVAVRAGDGGARWVVSIMGGSRRAGRWRVARRCRVINVMGSSDIDLNEVELAAEEVRMTVFSLMGGGEIYVPEDVRVEISDVGIMGGNDIERARPGAEPSDGPVIRLRLISIMGGTSVRRGAREDWKWRRAQRRLERRGG